MTDSPLFDQDFLQKIELLYLVSRKQMAGGARAKRKTRKSGAGLEVVDFRGYAAGDDLRHVDWNHYAATRDLLVRLYEEEEDLFVYFLVDASASMRVGDGLKYDHARRIAAALAYVGLASLDRVSIIPFGDGAKERLPPTRGKSRIWRVLQFLGKDPGYVRTNLEAAARAFVAGAPRPGLVVVLSDLYDSEHWQAGLDYLRFHRFEPLVIHIWDADDQQPDLSGDVELQDCETGERVLVTVTDGMLQALADAQQGWMTEVDAWCRAHRILYLPAPVQTPFDTLVLQVFRSGGFLR